MEQRKLGTQGLKVSAQGLGCMGMSEFYGRLDETESIATLQRALELGMVNRLVPEAQLEKTVEELIARIAAHSAPVLSMAKKAVLGGMGLSIKDGLKQSMDIFFNQLYRLEDSQEGLRALVEKRKPNWKNR